MSAEPEFQAKATDILAVIDTAEDQIALMEILTTVGYKPRPIEDPKLAIEAAILQPPDLVLLDIETPNIGSFELCRQLQQNERTRQVPVIIICSLDEVQDGLECFEAGRVDFISKPAQELEVLFRVNSILQLQEMQLSRETLIAERTTELQRLLQGRSGALKFPEEQIRTFFESSPLGVAVTNFKGQFLAVNKALAEMLRTTEEELMQRKVIEVYADPEQRQMLLGRLRKDGTLRDFGLHLRRDDGSTFFARLNSSQLNLEGREIILAMVDDVTEQIAAEHEAAVIEERERLARELHDAVTQTLFSASVTAQALPRMMEKNPTIARQNMEQLDLLIRGALAEMRTLLLELRPNDFTDKDLSQLFDLLKESAHARSRANIAVNVDNSCPPPEEVAITLYRIAQESLNNIVKHALASEVVVDIISDTQCTTLCIKDDGRGFEPQAIPAGHLGIKIMRERAKKIGAAIEIKSEIGHGSQVRVSWSAQESEPAHE